MRPKRAKRRSIDRQTNQKWLEQAQLNSWEAELLVSALTVYSLFQIPEYLMEFALINFETNSTFFQFISFLTIALVFIRAGFIFHLVVRSLWVASLGISYVFPKGIDLDRLRFKGSFRDELRGKEENLGYILKLEKLASAIYGVSFLLAGLLLGFMTFFVAFGLVYYLIAKPLYETDFKWLGYSISFLLFIIFVTGIFFAIDFFTNGYFRRKQHKTRWFYLAAKFFRIVTLSFLYRRSLLLLLSNLSKWQRRLLPFALASFIIGTFLVASKLEKNQSDRYFNTDEGEMHLSNYESLAREDMPIFVSIPSDVISDRYLRVFITESAFFAGAYAQEGQGGWNTAPEKQKCDWLAEKLQIRIDDTTLSNLDIMSTLHPTRTKRGFFCYLDLQPFSAGKHTLDVAFNERKLTKTQISTLKNYSLNLAQITFYKQ